MSCFQGLAAKCVIERLLHHSGYAQEDFSDEEDGQDEDLSAALATLRMQQESRIKGSEARRPGQRVGGKDDSVGGATGDGTHETTIVTQVVKLWGWEYTKP